MEDHALRLYIRAKLENGHLLPHDRVPNVWGGPGNGETCNGCEETVTKDQLGMEGRGINGAEVQFHVKCFYVWVAEPDLSGVTPRYGNGHPQLLIPDSQPLLPRYPVAALTVIIRLRS